jgi:hypothetical protein
VTWAWSEIEAGLAAGMKLKDVWEAAKKDGLDTSYAQFRVSSPGFRRGRKQPVANLQPASAPKTQSLEFAAAPQPDPFRNLREQRKKKKQSDFECDPFSINKNLIG